MLWFKSVEAWNTCLIYISKILSCILSGKAHACSWQRFNTIETPKDVRGAVPGPFEKCLLLFLGGVEMMLLPTRALQPQDFSHFSKNPSWWGLMTSKIDVMPSFRRL